MAPLIYAGVNGLLDKVPTDKITAWEKSYTEVLKNQHQSLLEKLSGGVLTPEIEKEMKAVIEGHVADFVAA
jgi:F-type H+-transporting ATPase subunit alpha